jgi:excisionase family DNA binding protein
MQEQQEYLNSEDAAKVLSVSLSKLYQMRQHDQLPFIKNGRKVMYRRSSLLEFLNNLEQHSATGVRT